MQLVLASLLIAICAVVTDGFAARDDGFYEWLSDLPRWSDALGTGLFLSCTVGAVTVVVLALLLSRNLRLVLTLVVVGVVTALLAGPMSSLIDLDALLRAAGVDTSSLSAESVVWLAVATAVLLTVAPYLVRPARRFVHAVQLLALLGAVLAAVAPVATILAAVGLGWCDLGPREPRHRHAQGHPDAALGRPGPVGARDLGRSARPRRPADVGRDALRRVAPRTVRPPPSW